MQSLKKELSIAFKKIKSGGGFTLIEAITAIFLMTVGIVGVSGLISQLIVSSTIASQKLTAAYLAQEGIEIVRNVRDTNWLEMDTWDRGLNTAECQAGCEADYTFTNQTDPFLPSFGAGRFLNITGNGFYGYSADRPTIFKRKITITKPEGHILEIKVQISWEERGRPHQLTARANLYNWR